MDTTIKYFTQHELRRIFREIEKSSSKHKLRDLAIIRVAYYCGLRASEVGLLRLSNYNKATGELYCIRLKGSWNNTIRLSKETIKVLEKYIKVYGLIKETDILFKSQENKPISRKTLDVLIKKYCSLANIEDRTKHHFHCLKHSCAVHLSESKLDIKDINAWLAHKNINNTLIYFQFTSLQQEEMYKKIEKSNLMV